MKNILEPRSGSVQEGTRKVETSRWWAKGSISSYLHDDDEEGIGRAERDYTNDRFLRASRF